MTKHSIYIYHPSFSNKITDLIITSKSLEADTLEFSIRGSDEGSIYALGDIVEVLDYNTKKTLFYGYITKPPIYNLTATSESWSITSENIISLIDATPYTESQDFRHILTNVEKIIDAKTVISQLVENGNVYPGGKSSEEKIEINLLSTIFAPPGSGSQSCWSLAKSCLHWVPNARSWYNPQNKKLTIGSSETARRIIIDIGQNACFLQTLNPDAAVAATGWLYFPYAPAADTGLRINDVHICVEEESALPEVWVNAINAANCGVHAAQKENTAKIILTATTPGAQGNKIRVYFGKALSGTGEGMYNPSGAETSGPYLTGGRDGWEDSEELFTFEGCESISLNPRHDLCPPAVGVNYFGSDTQKVFPAGSTLRQPWAFSYAVPEIGGAEKKQDPKDTQNDAAQRMVVRGYKVPDGWKIDGNMKTPFGVAEELRKFWAKFPGCAGLVKTNSSCLQFGLPVFNSTPVDIAYPSDENAEENDSAPVNYKEFVDGNIYVHYEGSFPASSNDSQNVPQLRFCRGVLKQYVWLKTDYVGTMTKSEFDEFFKGTAQMGTNDGKSKKCRYAILELEANFINRHSKKYKTGTNELDADDSDYTPPDEEEGGGEEVMSFLIENAAESFYNDTRHLYYDGSISLRGVKNYSPDMFEMANLSIRGARDEWNEIDTPVVQAVFNPWLKTLEISTGSPEILSIDERLNRMRLGAISERGAGTSYANKQTQKTGSSDSESFPMVAPSITAKATVARGGKPLNPFEVFIDDDGRVYMNEGTIYTNEGPVDFPLTDITEYYGVYKKFAADVIYENGKPRAIVRKFGKI